MPSGSRPGERRGGRQVGTPNKATVEKQQRAAAYLDGAQSEGPLPLDTMLLIMRRALERGDEATALDSASRAAGYCHPHLTSTQIAMESTNTHWVMSDAPMTTEEWCEKYGISYGGNGSDKKPA